MGQHAVLGRVGAVLRGGVGEAQDHLQPGLPYGVELLLELGQRGLAERAAGELGEVEDAHDERDVLVRAVAPQGVGVEVVLVAVAGVVVEAALGVGDVGAALCVGHRGRLAGGQGRGRGE
ncbi:hypothetical protein GCM10020001_074090 [Nonomuraea salmonea]